MTLTRSFKDTVQSRVTKDEAFRQALLSEAVQSLIENDLASGRSVLRNYINATIGFSELAAIIGKSEKSLMRMFSPKGNPTAANLFSVINTLQERTGVELRVRAA
jgi:DNA-binding phage protein